MGVQLDDGPAHFDRIEPGTGAGTYRVVLHEGRNREVRRLWQAVGFEVSGLMRLRYGPIELPHDLKPGGSRRLSSSLIERLAAAAPARSPPRAG